MDGAARLDDREADEPRPLATDGLAGKSLLDGLRIDYGPVDLLGRFFLKADAALRERGISFSFASLDELVEVNKRNTDTWKPLISIFDPAFGGINATNSFVMVGRNRSGDIVATQAARLFSWTNTTFAEEARSLRLFYTYPDRQKLLGETVEVTAPHADEIRGRVVFSGAVWIRPDYRGRFLTGIMPRISRANAFTSWFTDLTITMMADTLVNKGLAARVGYSQIDWDVKLKNTRFGNQRFALLKMQTGELLDDLAGFIEEIDAQVDRRIENRAG
ncbi:MAG: hypothetical protein ACKVP7_14595 [Hyphomicrobiaceae bacterium]